MKYKLTLRFSLLDLHNDEIYLDYVHYYNTLDDLNEFFNRAYLGIDISILQGRPWFIKSFNFEKVED